MDQKTLSDANATPEQPETQEEDLLDILKRMQQKFDNLNKILETGTSGKFEKDDQHFLKLGASKLYFQEFLQKINVDMIVSSTFCNADRLKYKTWRFFEGGPEFKVLESEARIQDLLTQWSVNCYEFDLEPGEGRLQDSELREKLYKVNIPVDEIYFIAHDKAEWVAMTKDLKWYGPFVSETSQDYFFKTWDPNGSEIGLTVYQRYDPDEIWINWTNMGTSLYTMVIQKTGELKPSTSPFAPPSEDNLYEDISDIAGMLEKFNFNRKDRVFNLDSIGKACFKNPLRSKYDSVEFSKDGEKFVLCSEFEDANDFGYRLSSFKSLQTSYKNFISHEDINIYDTSRLHPGIDAESWKSGLKNLRWYGPFKNASETQFFFKTFSNSGGLNGFIFHFDTEANKLRIHFRDEQNIECGESYEF